MIQVFDRFEIIPLQECRFVSVFLFRSTQDTIFLTNKRINWINRKSYHFCIGANIFSFH